MGGAGVDVLTGGLGADRLSGAGGADDFVYLAASDSTTAAADVITGFQIGIDDIDLSAIDANGAAAGNPAFSFIGGVPFIAAGQVRLVIAGGNTTVLVEIDGDGLADMQIEVQGVVGLTASDFIL